MKAEKLTLGSGSFTKGSTATTRSPSEGKGTTTAAVIVAHPGDETLWGGGFILERPSWNWFIVVLCRHRDPERAARFTSALHYLGADGSMADLHDDGRQEPWDLAAIRHAIREGLPQQSYDVVMTHGPQGESTDSRRSRECSRAVHSLLQEGHMTAGSLMLFSYDDRNGIRLPKASDMAEERYALSPGILNRKCHIIRQLYGFDAESWQSRTTPDVEAFCGTWSEGSQADVAVSQGSGRAL